MTNFDDHNLETRVGFFGDWPPDLRAIVEPLMRELEWIVPNWCRRIYLKYEIEGERKSWDASCSSAYEYRSATVYVHAGFFLSLPEERRGILMHELLHIALKPLQEFAADALERIGGEGDGPLRDYLREQHRRAVESVTQDLRNIVFDRGLGLTAIAPEPAA